MRHLIVEGPDGGGKTRLIEALMARYPLTHHAKASTSLRGPVRNLAAWVTDDIAKMPTFETLNVYDRHPVISEPIYGRVARGNPQPGFTTDRFGRPASSPWLSAQRLALYEKTMVIWCIPTLEQCKSAVDPERDMPGVVENIEEIYDWYRNAMASWGGPSVRYNLNVYPREVQPDGLFAGAVQFVDHNDYRFQECLSGA